MTRRGTLPCYPEGMEASSVPARPTRADAVVAAALFLVAAFIRTHHPAQIPVELDWAWFLRSASELSAGIAPSGAYPYLYTTVPPALAAPLVPLLGGNVAVMLVVWGSLQALAVPWVWLALARPVGRPAAFLMALALASFEAPGGRGFETPYLASTALLIAVGGAILGHHRRAAGPPLLVLGGALAAGMQPGLGAAGFAAVGLAAWDLSRLEAHRARVAAAAVLAGAGPLLIFVGLDGARILEDLSQDRAVPGFVEGAWFASFDPMILARQATGLGKVLSVLVPVLIVAATGRVGGRSLRGRVAPSGPEREADALAVRLGLLSLAAVGPYVVMAATTDYVSHVSAGQAMFLVASAVAARSLAAPWGRRAAAWAPVAIGIGWLVIPGWNGLRGWLPDLIHAEPMDRRAVPRALPTAWTLRGIAKEAGGQPLIYLHRHPELVPVTSLDPEVLSALAGLGFAGSEAPTTCFIIGDQGIGIRLGADTVDLGGVGDGLRVEAVVDPGCGLLSPGRGPGCAALPHGLRAPPGGRGAPLAGYSERCLGDPEG